MRRSIPPGGAILVRVSREPAVVDRSAYLTATSVILVEGPSDRRAVEAAARRLGRDLAAERVAVIAMGGVTNVGHYLRAFGPAGLGIRVAGMVDEGEAGFTARHLAKLLPEVVRSPVDLAAAGFHVCVADLEEELIRAVTPAVVEALVEEQRDLPAFRSLQAQPAWRGRDKADQLRRFFGSGAGRKIRYAPALVNALDPAGLPEPLVRLLASPNGGPSAGSGDAREVGGADGPPAGTPPRPPGGRSAG